MRTGIEMKATMSALAALLIAVVLHAADQPLRTTAVTILPLSSVGVGCPKIGADGQPTQHYTTVALEGNNFNFADPLPSDAVLASVNVAVYVLATCLPSNRLQVQLNPSIPNVDPNVATMGTVDPTQVIGLCGTAVPFELRELFSQPLITPAVTPYVRGDINTIAITEMPETACGDVRIERVVVTINYYADVPHVVFDLTNSTPSDQRRVLMSLNRTDSAYYSPMQEAARSSPDWDTVPTRDHRIRVGGSVTDSSGIPMSGQTVYLRPIDPPDQSPLTPANEVHRADDLFMANFNKFDETETTRPSGEAGFWRTVQTDSEGRFSATLILPKGGAGDNFRVEGTTLYLPYHPYIPNIDRCTTALGCYTSGVLTNWRRLYIEAGRMFKKGSFLRADTPAGSTEIPVFTVLGFENASATNKMHAVVVHGSSASTDPATNTMESVLVIGRGGTHKAPTLRLDPQTPLVHDYVTAVSSVDPTKPMGDAIGLYGTPLDAFAPELTVATQFFSEMSTELVLLTDGQPNASSGAQNPIPFFPYLETCSNVLYCGEVAGRWFDNRTFTDPTSLYAIGNHVHLVYGNRSTTLGDTLLYRIGDIGTLPPWNKYPVAFVWSGEILAQIASNPEYSGLTPSTVTAEVTAHELTHVFDVNPPVKNTLGHCASGSMAWDGRWCLMTPGTDRPKSEKGDGFVSLHIDPWSTSEFARVRKSSDPIPQKHNVQ